MVDLSVTPVRRYYSRIPAAFENEAKERILKMARQGIIERVLGPSRWVSAVNIVMKGAKDFRLTLNMKHANKAIIRPMYPFPSVDEIRRRVAGARFFSKVDLSAAFHHIGLAPEFRDLTCFMTQFGMFQFTRLVFGLSSAPELFQNYMDGVISGLPGAVCFIDDILMFADTKEHLQVVTDKVLARLKERNLTLNREKCEFQKTSLTFMGHKFSEHGMGITEEKIRAIRAFREPTTATETRSFIGLANFLAPFVPSFSDLTHCLRQAYSGRTGFHWGPEQSQAFETLKNKIIECASTVLCSFKKGQPTFLFTDASAVALGAVLTQTDDEERLRPIAYASRALSQTEMRYDQTHREALAVVWATEYFKYYLLGIRFTIKTDSSGAIAILSGNSLAGGKRVITRIQSWAQRLDVFDYALVHVPGNQNIADALSRLVVSEAQEDFNPRDEPGEIAELHFPEEDLPVNDDFLSLAEVERESGTDETTKDLLEAIRNNHWSSELAAYAPFRNELHSWRCLALRHEKIIVPQALRHKAIEIAHKGHVGMTAMKRILRERLWWPGVDRQVEQYVRNCEPCFRITREFHELPMARTTMPDEMWQRLAIDHGGPYIAWGGRHVLVVEDYCTRYVVTTVVQSTDTATTVKALGDIFETFGYPKSIRSDNGPAFGNAFGGWCKERGIVPEKSAAYDPQQNGMVEFFMKKIDKALRAAGVEKSSYDEMLRLAVRAHNATRHGVTKAVPEELFFARSVKRNLPVLPAYQHEPVTLLEEARDCDASGKWAQKNIEDEKRRASASVVQAGDVVVCADKRRRLKTDPIYGEEHFVVEKVDNNSVAVSSTTSGVHQRKAYRDVKKVPGSMTQQESQENSNAGGGADRDALIARSGRVRRMPARFDDFVQVGDFEEVE